MFLSFSLKEREMTGCPVSFWLTNWSKVICSESHYTWNLKMAIFGPSPSLYCIKIIIMVIFNNYFHSVCKKKEQTHKSHLFREFDCTGFNTSFSFTTKKKKKHLVRVVCLWIRLHCLCCMLIENHCFYPALANTRCQLQ